jgi:hypothetical protein
MKRLSIIALVVFISQAIYAQSDSKLHFGLKASPSLAWFRTDSKDLQSDGSKFGFTYGLITEFKFATNYAFATGIDVTYRGGKFKSENKVGDTSSVLKVNYSIEYIELPITLKLKTNEIGVLTYYLQAGVAPGINVRAKANVDMTTTAPGGYSSSSSLENQDVKDNINSFNLSMIIGGGVEYTLSGSTVLLTGIQFSNGFLDVFDGDNKVNSNYLALSIGVLF